MHRDRNYCLPWAGGTWKEKSKENENDYKIYKISFGGVAIFSN